MTEFRRLLSGRAIGLAVAAWCGVAAAAAQAVETAQALETAQAVETAQSVCASAVICQSLPCAGATRWDNRRENAASVAEARRRGYTLGYCAVVLRDPAPPPASNTPTAESLVASIQTLLSTLGHDIGPFDGAMGPKTSAAIVAFQRSVGVQADGTPSEALYARLKSALAERGGMRTDSKPSDSGTGFYISANVIITNNHVIEGCSKVRPRKRGAEVGNTSLIAVNQADDLAALRSDKPSAHYLRVRKSAVKPAEAVLVFGYPFALSSAGNTTLGNVTALSGLGDDPRFIQISASVQRGNSGGPVLDEAGRLAGVVQSKLDAFKFAKQTGEIPENVNFAIQASTLVAFLDAHRIAYDVATASTALPKTDLAEQAEAASVRLECVK